MRKSTHNHEIGCTDLYFDPRGRGLTYHQEHTYAPTSARICKCSTPPLRRSLVAPLTLPHKFCTSKPAPGNVWLASCDMNGVPLVAV